uniref:Uncharacterized protein n=1 Tax=Rhizophora mucronata TaxID=61149 RepID=A0A2P2LUI1_RHIMU
MLGTCLSLSFSLSLSFTTDPPLEPVCWCFLFESFK